MELEESHVLEELHIGDVNLKYKLGICGIYVYNNEGEIPHFHIISKNNDWECCVEIYKPLYFDHGIQQRNLNNKQCKLLDKWMSKRSTILPVSNWDMIGALWITSENPTINIPSNKRKPNYLLLNNKQCKLLDKWLKRKSSPFNITNWESISLSWDNSQNPSTNVPVNRIKPNYLLLNK